MGIIRLLLALGVVAIHFGKIGNSTLAGGQTSVQAFYIISGFYMSLILNEKYIGKNKSYRLFITNRFLRLYPIYWITLLLSVIFWIVLAYIRHSPVGPVFTTYEAVHINAFSGLYMAFTNLFIFGQDIVLFLGIHPDTGHLFFTSNFMNQSPGLYNLLFVPQAWTLGLELVFYLLAPFILTRGIKTVVAIIIASVLSRFFIYLFLGYQNDPWTYRFFPTEISFFLFGYLSYRIYLKSKHILFPRYVYIGALSGLVLFTVFFNSLPAVKFRVLPFTMKEIGYFTGIILSIPLLFNFFKKNKMDKAIGELSYPVYITHMLVGFICLSIDNKFIQQGWVIATLTIGFSWLLNYYVARPVELYRQSRIKRESLRKEFLQTDT